MAALPRLAPAFGPASGPDLTGAVDVDGRGRRVRAVRRRRRGGSAVVVGGHAAACGRRRPGAGRRLGRGHLGRRAAGGWVNRTRPPRPPGRPLRRPPGGRAVATPRRTAAAGRGRRRPRGRRAMGRRRPGAAVSGLPPPHAHRPRPRGVRCRTPEAGHGHRRRAAGQHGCRPGGDGRRGRSRWCRDPRGGVGRGRWAVAAGGAPPMGPAYRVPSSRGARTRGRPAASGRRLAYRTIASPASSAWCSEPVSRCGTIPRPRPPSTPIATVSQPRTWSGNSRSRRAPARPATTRGPRSDQQWDVPRTGDEGRPTRVPTRVPVRVSSASCGCRHPPTAMTRPPTPSSTAGQRRPVVPGTTAGVSPAAVSALMARRPGCSGWPRCAIRPRSGPGPRWTSPCGHRPAVRAGRPACCGRW